MEKKGNFSDRSLQIVFHCFFSSSNVSYIDLLAVLCCGGPSNSAWARRTIIFDFFRAQNLQIPSDSLLSTQLQELKNYLFFQKIMILESTGCSECLGAPGVFRITYWAYTNIMNALEPSRKDFYRLWVGFSRFFVYIHLYLPLRPQSQILLIFRKKITILKIVCLLASLWPVWIVINHLLTH